MVIEGVIAGLVVLYFFFCYCGMVICKKTGYDPGPLVWIPILQVFPMLKAAGMSGWWFLLLLIPAGSIVVSIIWSLKICQARGLSCWLALFLLLPVTSFFAFLYLTFSSGGAETDTAQERVTFA